MVSNNMLKCTSYYYFQHLDEDPGPSSSQKGSVYDGASRPIATAASTIENLQTQYKLKEGESLSISYLEPIIISHLLANVETIRGVGYTVIYGCSLLTMWKVA